MAKKHSGSTAGLPSTSFEYVQPEDLSNKCPQLRIHWDANVLRITGTELAARLDAGTPRIVVDEATGSRPDMMASSIIIMPYMMEKGEERIIANAIYEGLTKPGHYEAPVIPVGTPAPVQGIWAVTIQYPRGIGEQKFTIGQNGNDLTGIQNGEIYDAKLKGKIHVDQIELSSEMKVSGNSIPWTFRGVIQGADITGTVNMGEYGDATWKATRA